MENNTISDVFNSLENLSKNADDLRMMINILTNVTQMLKSDISRSSLDSNHWESLATLARKGLVILNKKTAETMEIHFLAELHRCLRNSCAGSCKNQEIIMNLTDVYNFINETLKIFLVREDDPNENEIVVLRCCLQLFGNLVCQGSRSTKTAVWNTFLQENAFMLFLQNKDVKVQEYTMMILYNCIHDTEDNASYILNTSNGHDILIRLTNSLCQNIIDWGILFLELIMKNENFMNDCYSILPARSRLLILDVIAEQLGTVKENIPFCVPVTSMHYIRTLFIELSMNIVQICSSDTVDLKVIEVVKLLSVLCAASVLDDYELKKSEELIEISIDTLKSVHLLGKKSCNAFSCISSLSEKANISKEDIENNPSYEFKKNLICLIGNLCYNCKENQDRVRKFDGLPLLLDCSNLDARNPFIMQWCILAIRNILEKNMENQEVLAGISVTGDLTNSGLLHELGFEVQNKNGKFVLQSKQSSS